MIYVKQWSRGRFGNKLLQLINVLQISNRLNCQYVLPPWDGLQVFEIKSKNQNNNSSHKIQPKFELNPFLDLQKEGTLNWADNLKDKLPFSISGSGHNMTIHNFFFEFANTETRNLLSVNKKYRYNNFKNEFTNIGIHIRGDDVSRQGDREYHLSTYYKDSIDFVISFFKNDSLMFYICSDDVNCKTFIETVSYINQLGIDYELGPATKCPVDNWDDKISHIMDFTLLTECDVLINSSSTYAVCAGMIGKDKKIIHSKVWIDKNTPGETYVKWGNYSSQYPEEYWKSFDSFWFKASKGNKYYKIWKLI